MVEQGHKASQLSVPTLGKNFDGILKMQADIFNLDCAPVGLATNYKLLAYWSSQGGQRSQWRIGIQLLCLSHEKRTELILLEWILCVSICFNLIEGQLVVFGF